jgi:6-pyruvoyltetrahydropterin/6-carboxytetrahydropterin synthase
MKSVFQSTKVIELGSCAFRQWKASHSHCRFLHGYQLIAKLWFSSSSLDDKNWAVDFGGLKDLKANLNDLFDHTTTIAADDPALDIFKDLDSKGLIQLRVMDKGVGIERAAETVYNIAQEHINALTNGRCWVDAVEVFEHEDNSAIYKPEIQAQSTTGVVFASNPFAALDTTTTNTTAPVEQPAPDRGATVGNAVTQGMGNPFAGTSWGA